MYNIYRFHKNIFRIRKIPIQERYECIDFIPKLNRVNSIVIPKTNFQISDKFKKIPFRERYETIDF